MEKITVEKWKTSDGQIFEDREEAERVEQRNWMLVTKDINTAGGLLERVYKPAVASLFDYIIASSLYDCKTVYESKTSNLTIGYKTIYVWQAKTIEQANRIAQAILSHGLLPRQIVEEMISKDIFTKYIGRTMAVQMVESNNWLCTPFVYSGYRVIDGLDSAFYKLHETVSEVKFRLYPPSVKNTTQGDSE